MSSSTTEFPTSWHRNSFQEAMAMTQLPDDTESRKGSVVKRFMGHTPAWVPGGELPWGCTDPSVAKYLPRLWGTALGSQVYCQSSFAAARLVEEEDRLRGTQSRGYMGIHSIQGIFTKAGLSDRPFVYDVETITSNSSFSARFVKVCQPTPPSSNPNGPFPLSDADLPLGETCFSSITTFKRATPHAKDLQLPSAQELYADILGQRKPDEWDPSPEMDVDLVKDAFPNRGHGGFPILDMYKVDMTAFNAEKEVPDRRELILYRLHKPLPTEDANAHILCHAYEGDRNGLIMLGNHLGFGYKLGKAASLTYSFYVHVDAEDAVMRGDGWWLQEVWWPRIASGRGMMEMKIWSPEGLHVASGYQDGIIIPIEAVQGRKGKKTEEKL